MAYHNYEQMHRPKFEQVTNGYQNAPCQRSDIFMYLPAVFCYNPEHTHNVWDNSVPSYPSPIESLDIISGLIYLNFISLLMTPSGT